MYFVECLKLLKYKSTMKIVIFILYLQEFTVGVLLLLMNLCMCVRVYLCMFWFL